MKQKPIIVNANNYRDYDVITNKYKENHKEKLEADVKCHKMHAAREYWKRRDYDHVIGKYIDENKEKAFIHKRSQTAENWGKDASKRLPPSIQK